MKLKMARLLTTIIFVLLVRTSVQGSEPGLLMNTKTERYETALALGLMEGFPPPPDKRIDRYNALFGVPYNRWSYQNMRRIYPSAPVLAAKEAFHLPRQINSEIETLTCLLYTS